MAAKNYFNGHHAIPCAGTSAVCNQFLDPLRRGYDHVTLRRNCPAESDWDWFTKGVNRVLANVRSGRDFLQTFQLFWRRELQVGPYFEALAGARRRAMVTECSTLWRQGGDGLRQSPLEAFAALAAFDLHAGDCHYLAPATHDLMIGETCWPTGHFFALKRQRVARARAKAARCCGLGTRPAGIYFLSLRQAGMCLILEQARDIDLPQPINQGVTADRLVADRRGLRVREITFGDPRDGEGHVYLTSAMTLAPGCWPCSTKRAGKSRGCLTKPRPGCRRKNPGRPRPRRCRRILWPSSTTCCCSCKMGTSNKAWKTPPKSSAVKTAGATEKRAEENRASPSADL